ncbi:hypothetical protein GCM10010182_28140 [Actinomadura cremea]|nr:hypothetical protein GCM10010182_28140 [Actinomadura cremea]
MNGSDGTLPPAFSSAAAWPVPAANAVALTPVIARNVRRVGEGRGELMRVLQGGGGGPRNPGPAGWTRAVRRFNLE